MRIAVRDGRRRVASPERTSSQRTRTVPRKLLAHTARGRKRINRQFVLRGVARVPGQSSACRPMADPRAELSRAFIAAVPRTRHRRPRPGSRRWLRRETRSSKHFRAPVAPARILPTERQVPAYDGERTPPATVGDCDLTRSPRAALFFTSGTQPCTRAEPEIRSATSPPPNSTPAASPPRCPQDLSRPRLGAKKSIKSPIRERISARSQASQLRGLGALPGPGKDSMPGAYRAYGWGD